MKFLFVSFLLHVCLHIDDVEACFYILGSFICFCIYLVVMTVVFLLGQERDVGAEDRLQQEVGRHAVRAPVKNAIN